MRTTLDIDPEVLAAAERAADRRMTKRELVEEALRAYVALRASRKLATRGGTAPGASAGRRRRGPPAAE
jgi:Arc/MetJ family transcription regulator